MTAGQNFTSSIKSAPHIHDAEAADRFRADLGEAFTTLPKSAQDLLYGVASCSPYLRRLALRRRDDLSALFDRPLAQTLAEACDAAHASSRDVSAEEQMRLLRDAKQRAAMAIALADIAGAIDVMEAAAALSRFADACVEGALAGAVARSPLSSPNGLSILAMGKHGAFELNYSSDIDLIVLFDPARMEVGDRAQAQQHAVAATKDLVNLLQMQTGDGYVFRTDLRLRPDPGVTAPAVSVASAEAYYEAYGQNWERMAFIKARPCAGDMEMGASFLQSLRPFIWRKYLDFAAIEDVHAVKRQMHSAKGGGDVAFEGHDVKLGRGGIREIEFYAQTQQLILGGRNKNLRQRETLEALGALQAAEQITESAREALNSAYRYLRHVEHRLQMINDEQTHRLPSSADEIQRVAVFCGERDPEQFREKCLSTFNAVSRRYDTLFKFDSDETEQPGPLVFTGVEAHPATLETLEALGFQRARDISAAIRRWHTGALRATRTERARVLLTKLVPPLLAALADAGEPDEAFFAFEDFLTRLPSGVQVFSLLLSNIDVFDTLIRLMTISPYLGRQFSKHINLVESLLDQNWGAPLRDPAGYAGECAEAVAQAPDYEAALNAARRWASETKFRITARLAVGQIHHEDAARHYTAIADASIGALVAAAAQEMKSQHGAIDGEFVVIGLGRLGAGEMTATSDIDLMFVYDAPPEVQSDGKRPLAPAEYFTRLVRRAVTALSAATEEGALYEVDMQLRPSGKAGPPAVSLAAFIRYYEDEAWTWEAMSLVKARVVGPDGALAERADAQINAVLSRRRDAQTVARDVADMRLRLNEAKPGAGPWDVKNISGGVTDIAFLCQYLTLAGAGAETRPPRAVGAALDWFAKKGELAQEDAMKLKNAHNTFEAVLQSGRAATGGLFAPEIAGKALRAHMASVCGENSIEAAERVLINLESEVERLFAARLA
ncbi:bifunctional [glutamine synthetase] adenylyltransferase/[glutamine synthetase]-adenylyl-L-tyrosine phosphorylase [Hyphococcus sp.]|uniref:bifunctional [glutamine synthetase] adenylyltransferase/[glutamine synthetase]-adenylyl-L-tyrosine phosphorylase n=1 Tax=Hyphococcus sp. TaxID=2038636 RepID=UPI003CCBFC86